MVIIINSTAKATQNEENTSFYIFRNIISDLIMLLEITTIATDGGYVLPGESLKPSNTF